LVEISTTDGRTLFTTLTKSCCSDAAPPDDDVEFVVVFVVGLVVDGALAAAAGDDLVLEQAVSPEARTMAPPITTAREERVTGRDSFLLVS
jgi:hypothetical protein